MRLSALLDPGLRGRLHELGKQRPVSSGKAELELGWTVRTAGETIVDTARSLLPAYEKVRN
ncbi:hypothetical protein ACWKSP_30965 [Micromonosporaceae bacterium Da 78-11]